MKRIIKHIGLDSLLLAPLSPIDDVAASDTDASRYLLKLRVGRCALQSMEKGRLVSVIVM